jgi:hypothetical protein
VVKTLLPAGRSDYSSRMAWRIHDNVIRGEIDNRVKGRVRGRLKLMDEFRGRK